MSSHSQLAQAQIAATDCKNTSGRILALLDNPTRRHEVPQEILTLQKDFARLLVAADQLELAP